MCFMKVLVVSNNYPSETAPNAGIFVYNLIQQFAKLGHEITIISAEKIRLKKSKINYSYGTELGHVYRPKVISASAKNIWGFNTYRIGEQAQIYAVKNVVKKNHLKFDVVYAHFLSNAFIAIQALSSFNVPIYVAVGEYNNLKVRRGYYKPEFYKRTLNKINGFIAVSPQIKERLQEHGVDKNKIIIKPNAVNFDLFFQRDKVKMRNKYNLPLDKKLIIFVGRFIENKGPLKLLEATESIDGLGLIFVGSGGQKLESDKILFKDKVSLDKVPELLSAADLFVLPTLHEGSNNAIIEAMACGLPIVSSDIPEIQYQCNSTFSILVDPQNVSALSEAIIEILSNKKKLMDMSKNAIQAAKKFNIVDRAKGIIEFIQP